jgi:hypothetical protein
VVEALVLQPVPLTVRRGERYGLWKHLRLPRLGRLPLLGVAVAGLRPAVRLGCVRCLLGLVFVRCQLGGA